MASDVVLIPLKNRVGSVIGHAIIDARDAWMAREIGSWYKTSAGYAAHTNHCNGVFTQVFMHRLILGVEPGKKTDHINGNRLDNRRENLRFATMSQNARNRKARVDSRSLLKGVVQPKGGSLWKARIFINGKTIQFGAFASELEAARAYDEEARKHFGEFARLNFPAEK